MLEAVEDGVELLGRDTAAFVGDFEQDGVRSGFGVDPDGGSCWGELDGVGEEVGEDLEDSVCVAVEEEGVRYRSLSGGERGEFDVDGVGVRHGRHGLDGLLGKFAEGAASDLQGGASGFHALEVKDVVDKANEAIGIGDCDAEEVLRFGVYVADDTGGEQAEGSANAGEGSAQLVGDGGDEFVFEGVELGAMGELDLVLMLFFACVCKLACEVPNGSLSTNKSEEQDSAGAE